MALYKDNIILGGLVTLIILTFIFRLPMMCRPKSFCYKYSARTRYKTQDHIYIFENHLMKNGCYRCYIEQAPFLFGKRFSRYTIDYGYDKECGRCYILSNRMIRSVEDAKELCDEWSDFNQYVIDSHRFNI